MKALYYDCFSGISGDMNLGAMIDVGVPKEYLIDQISKLKVDGYEIKVTRDERKGIFGTKVEIELKYNHNETGHRHLHRGLKEIEDIIENSDLNNNVKKLSMKIFMEVAKAEAKVHNKPLYEVHFHEVGAIDSIIDTVGAAICLDYLKVDKVICSEIELGGGFVKCEHGVIPVPAPAVTEILQEVPVKTGAVQFETTTPTGAAILKSTVNEFKKIQSFKTKKVGYGIGHRDTEIPNVLRVFLIEETDIQVEKSYIVECNIDDMNPEKYDYIIEELLKKGVADVFLVPIIMKKGRPAVKLSVLCSEKKFDEVKVFIFKETSTLGVRYYEVERNMLARDFSKVNTRFGEITVKNAYLEGKKIKSKPEYEECKRIAKEKNMSLAEVYEEVNIYGFR